MKRNEGRRKYRGVVLAEDERKQLEIDLDGGKGILKNFCPQCLIEMRGILC